MSPKQLTRSLSAKWKSSPSGTITWFRTINHDKLVISPFTAFIKFTFSSTFPPVAPSQICTMTRHLNGGLASKQVVSLCMRRCDFQTHACETGGHSDPGVKLWLILHQAQREGLFLSRSPLWDQPQLLDGRMAWLPAKCNVYTNTHNCSVRMHGELTIRRRGSCVLLWILQDRCSVV